MAGEANQLVGDLRNFRTRRGAEERLLKMGSDAVQALIDALDDRSEGAQWSAIKCLGIIGDQSAIGPLVKRLVDDSLCSHVTESLRQITGETLGDDAEVWEEWFAGQGGSGGVATAAGDALIEKVVEGEDVSYEEIQSGYSLTVKLQDGRHQDVKLLFSSHDAEGADLIVVYTECGPAAESNHGWALRQNMKMPYGAIAIREIDGEQTFVMVNTHLRETATAAEVKKSVFTLASKADNMEKALTKADTR